MKTIKTNRYIGDILLFFESENLGAGYLDTTVKCNDAVLCWITYSEIDNFVNELNDVINKYRI